MKETTMKVRQLKFIFLIFSLLILSDEAFSEPTKTYQSTCEYFLSYSLKPDQKIKIVDTNSVLHSGIFKRYSRVSKLITFTNDSLALEKITYTLHLHQIDEISYERKRLNMAQIRQATLIGTVGGLLTGLIYINSNNDFAGSSTGSGEKFRKVAAITLGGTLIGVISGLIGNDNVMTDKTIRCE